MLDDRITKRLRFEGISGDLVEFPCSAQVAQWDSEYLRDRDFTVIRMRISLAK